MCNKFSDEFPQSLIGKVTSMKNFNDLEKKLCLADLQKTVASTGC